MSDLTKEQLDEALQRQAKTFARLIQSGGKDVGPGGSGSGGSSRFSETDKEANDALKLLSSGFGRLGEAGTKVFNSFKEIYEKTNENIGMMQSLSKSGMNFSSDVVGMTASIKEMRLSNDEFAEVMTKNAVGFTALGGNATRGAEAFAKLAGDFQKSEFIDGLNAAGFSSKELTDLLALQVTVGKMALKDDKKSRDAAIESAARLANEMDLVSKLTGKSREEQMQAQQKLKDDMALEAKLRMETAGMAPEEAAKYRETVFKQIAQAELEGRGQLLKEQFIHGQAVSEQAIMQQQTMGHAAYDATIKQGDALRAKQLEIAENNGKEARRAASAFGDTAEGIFLATLPGNEAITKSAHEVMKANQGYRDSLAAIRQEAAFKGATDEVIEKEATRRAEDARKGINAQGEEVKATTETMVKLKNRAGDVEAAFYSNLIVPLNKDISKSLKDFNAQFLPGALRRAGQDDISYKDAVGTSLQYRYERERDRPANLSDTERMRYDARTAVKEAEPFQQMGAGADVHANAARIAGTTFNKAGKVINDGLQELQTISERTRRYNLGTLGVTGKLFEDFGQGTMVELHGKEAVINEKQLADLASGMKQQNIGEVFNKLMTSTQKFAGSDNVKSTMSAMANQSGLADMMNRMSYSISSKSATQNAINFQTPKEFKDMKISPDEMQKAVQTMMSGNQAYLAMMEKQEGKEKKVESKPKPEELFTGTIPETAGKKATLDDVVSSLNQLNIKMTQLLDTHVEIGSKQISAVKSNSRNVFERF